MSTGKRPAPVEEPVVPSSDGTTTSQESSEPPAQKPRTDGEKDESGKNYYLHKDVTGKPVLSAQELEKLEKVPEVFEVCPEDKAWWRSTVVYEVYVRSFMDSNGDGIGDLKGTLKGIQSKLDYFVDLGVETLWLSPFYVSPMKDFGYDISDFTDVDPIFGTLKDFGDLIGEMKQKGLKLIMDFVPNHTSDQHKWFVKSCEKIEPYTDYYVWKPAKGLDKDGKPIPPNNWVSVFGGSMWEWNEQRSEFYLHQFTKEQPDLNFHNLAVVNEIKNVIRFWLDRGVDGFRMDAVAHLFEDEEYRDEPMVPNPDNLTPVEYGYWDHRYTQDMPQLLDILREFRMVLDEYSTKDDHPRLMMTEAYLEVKHLVKYYGSPEKPIAHFPFNFDLISSLAKGFQAFELYTIIKSWIETTTITNRWPNWVLGNHDVPRVASRFGPEIAQLLIMITMLLPGTNVSYYGEEIGMEDMELSWEQTVDPAGRNAGENKFRNYSRDPERTPMQWNDDENGGFTTAKNPWLPMNKNYRSVNVASQTRTENSNLQNYKRLVSLRKSTCFLSGSLQLRLLKQGNVLAFSRVSSNGKLGFLVLANFTKSSSSVDTTIFNEIAEKLQVSISTSGESNPVGTVVNSTVSLGPLEGVVLTFET